MNNLQKEIKLKIQDGNFETALKLCEEAELSAEGKCFAIYSFAATCSLQLKLQTKAAEYFEKSLQASPPAAHVQKIWKNLADLYLELEMWVKHGDALFQLYTIISEKGNFERACQIAEEMTESYMTAKLVNKAANFIQAHLESNCIRSPDHTLRMLNHIGCLQGLLESQIDNEKRTPTVRALGSASLAKSKETNDSSRFDAVLSLATPRIIREAVEVSKQNDLVAFPEVIQMLSRDLQNRRRKCLSVPSSEFWQEILFHCIEIQNVDSNSIFVEYLIEAWFFCESVPYDLISSAVESVLQVSVDHPAANAAKAWNYLSNGYVASGRAHVAASTAHWITQSKFKLSNPVLIDESISTLCLFVFIVAGGLDGYRSVSVQDVLHGSQEAIRRVGVIDAQYGAAVRGSARDLLHLSRVCALISVCQHEVAVMDALKYLPHLFTGNLEIDYAPPSSSSSFIAPSPGLVSAASKHSLALNETQFLNPLAPIIVKLYCLNIMIDLKLLREVADCADRLVAIPQYSGMASLILNLKAKSLLMASVDEQRTRMFSLGHCLSPTAFSYLELCLSDQTAALVIRAYQAAQRTKDVAVSEIDSIIRLHMGLAMWLAGGKLRREKTGCLAFLLAAAKGDPTNSLVFALIGHFYFIEQGDVDRAAKCYIKALGFDPLNREAGMGLSQLYLKIDDAQAGESKALKLWSDVANLTSHARWCFLLRARYHLFKEQFDDSVNFFQRALELDADDPSSWHGLGVSYMCLRQHSAARKAFLRALEHAPNDIALLCALGDVERKLCLLIEATEHFSMVLRLCPNDMAALKGSADVSLIVAYQQLTIGCSTGSARSVFRGIAYIDSILTNNSSCNDQSVWKLLGDLCCFAHHLSPSDVTNATNDMSTDPNRSDSITGFGSMDLLARNDDLDRLLERGEKAYRKVLELATERHEKGLLNQSGTEERDSLATAWYDVGTVIYCRAACILRSKGQGSGLLSIAQHLDEDLRRHFFRAKKSFIAGLRLNIANSGCWNGVGLCVFDDVKERQACFVRATQIDSNAAAYANLGLLMMSKKREDAAQDCFSALQLIESNPLIWVSLGNIIESNIANTPMGHAAVISAHDAYISASEVAKPPDAMLGSALSWLRLRGYLAVDGSSKLQSCDEVEGRVREREADSRVLDVQYDLQELRHEVELKLVLFLRYKPVHPQAWGVLAWALEARGAFGQARRLWLTALKSVNIIAESLMSKDGINCDQSIRQRFEWVTVNLMLGYRRCGLKMSCAGSEETSDNLDFPLEIFSSLSHLSSVCPRNFADLIRTLDETIPLSRPLAVPSCNDNILLRVKSTIVNILTCGGLKESLDFVNSMFTDLDCTESSPESLNCFIAALKIAVTSLQKCTNPELRKDLLQILSFPSVSGNAAGVSLRSGVFPYFNKSAAAVAVCAHSLMACGQNEAAKNLLVEACSKWHPDSALLRKLVAEASEGVEALKYADEALKLASEVMATTRNSNDGMDFTDTNYLAMKNDESAWLQTPPQIYCRAARIKAEAALGLGLQPAESVCIVENCVVIETENAISARTTRNILLRGLHLDPTNVTAWNTLASLFFADAVVGDSDPVTEHTVTGSDSCSYPSLKICSNIVYHLNHSSEAGEGWSSAGDVYQSLVHSGIQHQFAGPQLEQCLSLAQSSFVEGRYSAAEEDWQRAIQVLERCSDSYSDVDKKIAQWQQISLWRKLGNLYSIQLRAECAQTCFRHSSTLIEAMLVEEKREHKIGQLRGLLDLNNLLTALSRVRKYSSSKAHEDFSRARDLLENASSSTPFEGSPSGKSEKTSNSYASSHPVANALLAVIWSLIGKPAKSKECFEKSKSAWPHLNLKLLGDLGYH